MALTVPPLTDPQKQQIFEEYQRRMRTCVPWSPAMTWTPELNLIGATFETLNPFPELAPSDAPVDEAAAGAMFALMAEIGGEELVGTATTLPEGVFVQPGS